MKNLVLLLFGAGDHTGTHQSTCRHFAQEFLQMGYEVNILFISDENSVKSLIDILKTNRVFLVHVEQGQLLNIQVNGKNLFDLFDVPVCSQMRDHWFYPWLFPHISNPPKKAVFVHTDSSFKKVSHRFRGEHFFANHTAMLFSELSTKHDEKSGKPIFVGGGRDIDEYLKTLIEKHPHLKSFFYDLYDNCRTKTIVPEYIWDINLSQNGKITLLNLEINQEEYNAIFQLASSIIRSNFLNFISHQDCKIVVKGNWMPPKNAKADISLSGISKTLTQKLMNKSRLILNDQSSFLSAIGERVASSVVSGNNLLMRRCEWSQKHGPSIKSIQEYETLEDIGNILETKKTPSFVDDYDRYIPYGLLPRSYVTFVVNEVKKIY